MDASTLHAERSRWPLVAGLALSVCLHLGAAAVLAVGGGGGLPFTSVAPTPPPEDDSVRLGVDRSDASTITWLGFEEPTPHEAPRADIEQASLAIAAAERVADEVQRAAAAAPRAIARVAEAVEREREAARAAGVEAEAMTERLAELLAALPEARPQAVGESPAEREQTEQKPASGAPSPRDGAGEASSSEGDAPEDAAPATADTTDGNAEKEAAARSLKDPVKVSPGRPVAAEGLNIRTIRPRWSHTTLLTSRPRDPVIRVFFNREGVVERAVFERPSGSKFVDEPLLNAVYEWRASGERLEKLPAEGNEALLELVFEISLR